AQPAKPLRANVENVLREDRQQRGRTAKQNSEQVERNRGENHLRLSHKTHPRGNRVESHLFSRLGRTAWCSIIRLRSGYSTYLDQRPEINRCQHRADDINAGGAVLDSDRYSAAPRPYPRRYLERTACPGNRIAENVRRKQLRQQRLPGRVVERLRCTPSQQHRVYDHHGSFPIGESGQSQSSYYECDLSP